MANPREAWLWSIGPQPDGSTPLEPEDAEGLIPTWVATRGDLNQAEYESITAALPWALKRARAIGPLAVLDDRFLLELHRRMFAAVWRWSGAIRRRETNVGVAPHRIVADIRQAVDDARYWHAQEVYPPTELAVRLHYRLVTIHPFRNGNGRATRLLSDLYLAARALPALPWGASGQDREATRMAYLAAIRRAALDDCASLIEFARS